MNILDDIYGLLSSKISTKQIATQCRANNIDTTTIKNIREIKDDTARRNEILKLPLSLAREIGDFCINYTFTDSEKDAFINYCDKLISNRNQIVSKGKEGYSIRLSQGQINRQWGYCNIAKDSGSFGNKHKGAFDRSRDFKIPVNAAMNILDVKYIPHFYNSAD